MEPPTHSSLTLLTLLIPLSLPPASYSASVGQSSVRVFLLQPDIWEPPRDDVYLRFNMTNQQEAADLTVCSRVYPTALTILQVLFSYATADTFSNALMMYVRDGVHFFRFNNKPQEVIERLEVPTVLRQWRHYCHVLSGDTYTLYVDGEALASSPIQVDDRVLPLNGTFVVGQEQDALSSKMNSQQILKGYTTQVNMWSYGLSPKDVMDITRCRKNLVGDIFSSDTSAVELLNVVEESWPLESFCMERESFLIFPEKRNFQNSARFCHLLNTELYASLTRAGNRELNSTMSKEDFCGGGMNLWLGVTDEAEEGTWRRLTDKRRLQDIPFAGGQPDNTTAENCMMVVGGEGVWADFNCYEKNLACAPCDVTNPAPLYMRGTCRDMKTETMFEVLGYFERKPYFHGFYGYTIVTSGEREWVMFDTKTNTTLALLTVASRNVYPIGRHVWRLAAPICDQAVGSELELSLSICEDGQYMCDDGQCIDLAARCDAKDDCGDETDEDNCSIIRVPAGYRAFKPPKNLHDPTQPLQPELNFEFLRFLKIEDVQRAIQLEFIVTVSWTDTRLKYLNLRAVIHANKLSTEEESRIWRASLEFTNIKDGELDLLKDDVFVRRTNERLPFDFNNVDMDPVYGGAAAEIVQQQHYSGSFVCSFDVFYYPFDVQRCSVLVQLSSLSKELVQFTVNRSRVSYKQGKELPTYLISDFYVRDSSDGQRESLMEIGYTLTRRYTLIVLSVFMPSTMLMIIGYATLYVKVELLQVRLVVSLTTLLVLYTFFSQASSSLPQTAYVKMIDVWFFFCTILLFVIIMVHVFVECLERESVVRVGSKMAPKFSYPRLTAQNLLRLFRFLVVPPAALVFICVYWSYLIS